MQPIPRKEPKISKQLGSFKGSKLSDELVLAPGEVLDLSDPDEAPAELIVPDPSQDVIPVAQVPRAVAANSNPRRISPLISGKKMTPVRNREIATVSANRPAATQSQQPPVQRPTPPGPAPRIPARPIDGTEVIVQLGRVGDILNILPICHEVHRTTGRRARLMIAKEFRPVLDGCSYVEPIVFDGHYGELEKAIGQAKRLTPNVRTSQVYCPGKEFPRKHESYQRDAWARIGCGHRFEQLSLIFDRRSEVREAALIDRWTTVGKPFIAVALDAISVPFPHKQRVIEGLLKSFPEFQILDLSQVKADRFYDMLGLIDSSRVLVACDSAIQHLAQASSTPVVAFRCNDPWRASVRRANHILNRRYSDVDMNEVTAAIKTTFLKPGKISHVYPLRENDAEEQSRNARATESWDQELNQVEGAYVREGVSLAALARNSTKVGDPVATPYVLDLIERAMGKTSQLDDIVLFTNGDIGLTPGTQVKLRTLLVAKGAVFGYRFNHPKGVVFPPSYAGNVSGYWDGGLDLFAFTRRWLLTHGAKLPDLLIGRTGWDLVYRDVIKKTGGGELYGCIWHEAHTSWWKGNMDTAGNQYNLERLKKYHNENDITRPYDR